MDHKTRIIYLNKGGILELNDTIIKKLCRTCLTINTEETISIFDEIVQVENNENVKTYICDMLLDAALIELDTKDSLPTSICINCLQLAQQLLNFRKQCNRSQAILLEYLTEKEDKLILATENSPNQNSNVLNKKSVIKKSIDTDKSSNETASVIVENGVQELSNRPSSDDFIRLNLVDEIIVSDVESDNVIEISSTKQITNKQSNVLNKKPAIKESIDMEKSLNENNHESITIVNNVHKLSNLSISEDLLNSSIRSDSVVEIIKLNAESECNETLHSSANYDKDKNVFVCRLCEESFKTDALYFAHMKQHPEDSICNLCNRPFKHRWALIAHMRYHTEDKYECNVCNTRFKHLRLLTTHMKQHADDIYVCDVCSKHFKYRKNLTNHMKQHTKEVCVCKICNKRFKRTWNLTVHMRTHKDEKRYSCKVCGKGYKQSGSLVIHMRIHTGQTPFLCTVCGKAFRDSTSYKIHMRTHTKERPYMCNVCGRTMSVQSHFVQHMRTHTGEKPHKCTECSKAFRSIDQLKRHTIIHTGLKPFSCDVCKKSFNRKTNLRVHEKIHKNERPHTCSLCGKSFIQAHCLRSHLQNHK